MRSFRRDEGTALGLVLIFVTILGVWLASGLFLSQVSYTAVASTSKTASLDNGKAKEVATILSGLYKLKSCDATTLPKGYTCLSVPDTSPAAILCKTLGPVAFFGNNGNHYGQIKNGKGIVIDKNQIFEDDFLVDNDGKHVHLKVKFKGRCGEASESSVESE